MARTNSVNYTGANQFPMANAAADIFKKEDLQVLAKAVDAHVHDGAGLGLPVAFTGVPAGSIPGTALANGAVTSAKIADGTIATVDLADASVTNAKLGSDTARLNLLTNGGFEIWQRGNGPFTGNLAYISDRWFLEGTGLSVSVTSVAGTFDTGSQFAAACTYSGSASNLTQAVEAYPGSLRGRVVSGSVRVKTSAATAARLTITSDGTAPVAVTGAFHTGGGNFETLTASGFTVPADATKVFVRLGFSGAASTFYVDNAMLVVGLQYADYAPLHPADDLARCLRYYEQFVAGGTAYLATGQVYATTNALNPLAFQPKAVTPTVTYSAANTFAQFGAAGAVVACTAVSTLSVASRALAINTTVASGLVAGNASALLANSTTATVSLEANP